jgi:putative nucleotidyltransferase with HDIG domain
LPSAPTSAGRRGQCERGLAAALASETASIPDWAQTANHLLALAKQKLEAFDFDSAIQHLCTIEKIWNSKRYSESTPELRLELHQELGKAYASQGRLGEAIQEHQKILALCREVPQQTVKSESYLQIGQLLCKQGDFDRALGYVQRAIAAYRRQGNQLNLCKALRNLGVIYVELGDLEEADITYKEAISIAQEAGDRLLHADLINNMGAILNMRGKRNEALELYTKSLIIYERMKEIRKNAYTKNNIGITLAEMERTEEALAYFMEAHAIAHEIKDSSLELIVDINLADLFLKQEDFDAAQRHLESAEKHLKKSSAVNGNLVEVKKLAGMVAARRGDTDLALALLSEACELGRQLGTQYTEAEVLLERGTVLKTMGRHFEALSDLEASYLMYTHVDAPGKRDTVERVIGSIENLYLDVFDSMAKEVERKDEYTRGHSDRVASLALILGKDCGLRPHMLKTLVAAGLLHDIGKISLDSAVLKKTGPLTDEERCQIQKHPELGVDLLRGKEFPWNFKPFILHHHEKLDGTGYPMGLKGEDVPLGARILSIVDVFDALTSERVYRPAFSIEQSLQIMNEESGTSFDPILLRRFCKLVHDGKVTSVINSKASKEEVYRIWPQCMAEGNDSETVAAAEVAR